MHIRRSMRTAAARPAEASSVRPASRALAAGLGLALGLAVPLATPAPARAENAAKEFGLGVSCVAANLVYGPAKTFYATGGGLVAGMAWLFSGGDDEVARPIVDASMRGDFVLGLDHLRGKQPIEFVGRSPEQERMRELAGDSQPSTYDEGF